MTLNFQQEIEAPILKNQIIGTIQAKIKDEVILSRNIQIKEEIPKKQIWNYIQEIFLNYTKYLQQSLQV